MVFCLAAAAVEDGGLDAGVDGGIAATWRLSTKLGKGAPLREGLIAELTAGARDAGVGESALTREEAEALLDDPRAELVYGDKTVLHRRALDGDAAPAGAPRPDEAASSRPSAWRQARSSCKEQGKRCSSATEKRTGVDREVIIGILMWESKLGTITGDYVAFNALTSQAFFIDEANAVALAREEEKALSAVRGHEQAKRREASETHARVGARAQEPAWRWCGSARPAASTPSR